MSSDEGKLYIKITSLDAIYSIVVENFFEFNLFRNPKHCCKLTNFEIWNYQTTSDVDMVYKKLIVLDTVYNFVVKIFLFEIVQSAKYVF
jgi:hypothetical protein